MDEKYRKIASELPERLEGNLKTLEQICETYFNLLASMDLPEVSVRCGASLEDGQRLVLKYFKKEVGADTVSRKLYYIKNHEYIDIFTTSIILHYLVTADGEPSSGHWISYRELPDGMFYFRTIPGVLEPLLGMYEDSFESLAAKAGEFGGKKSSLFKNGVIVYPFPHFPVMFLLEEKSEEFDSDLRVLFDSSAPHYMKTDIIKVLLVNIVKIFTR